MACALVRSLNFSLLLIVALISFLTALPLLVAFTGAPAGYSWTGILSRNTADTNDYVSLIEEMRQGRLVARNLYTAESHPPFQVRPFHALLAQAGRLFPRISSVALLAIGQFLGSVLLLILLAMLSGRISNENQYRIPVFMVLALGSGLGWTGWVRDPPDLRIVETNTFLTLLSPPIQTISLALVLAILLTTEKTWKGSSRGSVILNSALAGLFGLWLGFERPFSLATLSIALTGALLLQWARSRRLPLQDFARVLPLAVGAGFAISYQFHLMRVIPIYAQWQKQHILQTPEWDRLLISWGLLFPLALFGFSKLLRTSPRLAPLLIFYAIGSLVLSHAPFPNQERFLEGLVMCLSLFAAAGLAKLLQLLRSRGIQAAVACAILSVLVPSSFLGLRSDLKALARTSPPQYMPDGVLEGMRALSKLASPDETVLSSFPMGNFIPAYASRQVVVGHSIITAQFKTKYSQVLQIFRTSAKDRQAEILMMQTGARWLFWSAEEASLARGKFDPDIAPFLERKYSNGAVIIYRIKQ